MIRLLKVFVHTSRNRQFNCNFSALMNFGFNPHQPILFFGVSGNGVQFRHSSIGVPCGCTIEYRVLL